MESRIENLNNLLGSLLNDLEYVVRISSLYGLIGCRAYIEKILNIILKEQSITVNNMHLIDKIDFLEERNLLKGRLLTEIQTIRYMGNDASHKLIGTESEAKAALSICKKFRDWFFNQYNHSGLKEGKSYLGIVRRYGNKKYGFIKESNTGKDIYFKLDKDSYLANHRLKEGNEVKFKVRYTKGNTPYKGINLKLVGKIKNLDQNDHRKFGFIVGENGGDIYFSFNNLSQNLKEQIAKGKTVAFKVKKGSNKDEAYDLELVKN